MINKKDFKLENTEQDRLFTAKRIKELRELRGLTQRQLAEKIHKTESSIRKYEKGLVNIPFSTIEDIASALGTYWMDIVKLSEEEMSGLGYTHNTEPNGIYIGYLGDIEELYHVIHSIDIIKEIFAINFPLNEKLQGVSQEKIDTTIKDIADYMDFKIGQLIKNSKEGE